jgi:hypothetical protein
VSLLDTSDKVFWHGYIDFYEGFFKDRSFKNIAELGVFKGNSIRWLLERFPDARVCGADILPLQPEWPLHERFQFTQLDQGDVDAVRGFLTQRRFDLIIEDGSHLPKHQVLCLMEGIRALQSGGIYILEDIHTSHPSYAKKLGGILPRTSKGNALSVLLAISHYQRLGMEIDAPRAQLIAKASLLAPQEVDFLAQHIAKISLYRRTRLPDYCYKCGAVDYDFSTYSCKCGAEVFSDSDSMSFVIERL